MADSEVLMTLYDEPMWRSMERRAMELPACDECGRFRYPPGPICPHCLSRNYTWRTISGHGIVLSWVVYQRQYFDDFPVPYNVVAVQLEEGPVIVSNLVGPEPEESWIGAAVVLDYRPHGQRMQHVVRLRDAAS